VNCYQPELNPCCWMEQRILRKLRYRNMCSTQTDNHSPKLRLRCGCQFPWCALALKVIDVRNSDATNWLMLISSAGKVLDWQEHNKYYLKWGVIRTKNLPHFTISFSYHVELILLPATEVRKPLRPPTTYPLHDCGIMRSCRDKLFMARWVHR
jgi:hypothetical protein